ncbi:MAG: hypothetical protein OXG35_30420, partial [Acidobacteria bacterium]|nr:hypothetical protein [Acidobacteriota bacterium]
MSILQVVVVFGFGRLGACRRWRVGGLGPVEARRRSEAGRASVDPVFAGSSAGVPSAAAGAVAPAVLVSGVVVDSPLPVRRLGGAPALVHVEGRGLGAGRRAAPSRVGPGASLHFIEGSPCGRSGPPGVGVLVQGGSVMSNWCSAFRSFFSSLRGRCLRRPGSSRRTAPAVVAAGVAAVLLAPAPVVAQSDWSDLDYRDSGPLFWLPEAHPNWPRLATMWLPNDSCSPDPYHTLLTDVHDPSCSDPNSGLSYSWVIWQHRTDRDGAEKEFGTGSSFDHDDLNTIGTSPEINPWHWRLSGMPESQRCFPAEAEISYHAKSGGWGGMQISQHVGEWYQGRLYLPEVMGGMAGLPASGAESVTRFGFFDFDIYSRPELADLYPVLTFTPGSCAAVAAYDQYQIGAGGPDQGTARACAAESVPLLMRGNTELRCEPDLSLWQDHVYAEDFKEILERHMDPDRPPTRENGWWPLADDTFTHDGVVYNIRAFLDRVGLENPIQPGFPHNWDTECDLDPAGEVFGCGPGDTESNRDSSEEYRRTFGSRPIFRRMEVSIAMPGESVDDAGDRSIPQQWPAAFGGYLTEGMGDTPNDARDERVDPLTDGDLEYGSLEWLQERLTDEDGTLRFTGTEVTNILEASGEEYALSDCLRLIPSDAPIADSAGVSAAEFWNSGPWRQCAQEAFDGDTARLSSGMLALATWLRFQDGDGTVDRALEVARTNLDTDGFATGAPGVSPNFTLVDGRPQGWVGSDGLAAGMPEVPGRNQRILNSLLGLGDRTHSWYRTAGSEISCLWGGLVMTDLASSADAMEQAALAEIERILGELVVVQQALEVEVDETTRVRTRSWPGGTRNHRLTDLGCDGTNGYRLWRDDYEQQTFTETCVYTTTIFGDVFQVDYPTAEQPDQSGHPHDVTCSTTSSWSAATSYHREPDDSCSCTPGRSETRVCSSDGTSRTEWIEIDNSCGESSGSVQNGRDPSCQTCAWEAGECSTTNRGFRIENYVCNPPAAAQTRQVADVACNCDQTPGECVGFTGTRNMTDSCTGLTQAVEDATCPTGDWEPGDCIGLTGNRLWTHSSTGETDERFDASCPTGEWEAGPCDPATQTRRWTHTGTGETEDRPDTSCGVWERVACVGAGLAQWRHTGTGDTEERPDATCSCPPGTTGTPPNCVVVDSCEDLGAWTAGNCVSCTERNFTCLASSENRPDAGCATVVVGCDTCDTATATWTAGACVSCEQREYMSSCGDTENRDDVTCSTFDDTCTTCDTATATWTSGACVSCEQRQYTSSCGDTENRDDSTCSSFDDTCTTCDTATATWTSGACVNCDERQYTSSCGDTENRVDSTCSSFSDTCVDPPVGGSEQNCSCWQCSGDSSLSVELETGDETLVCSDSSTDGETRRSCAPVGSSPSDPCDTDNSVTPPGGSRGQGGRFAPTGPSGPFASSSVGAVGRAPAPG